MSTKKRWTDAQTSPRLWNLYLALSKGLTAKKIELYGVFYPTPHHCYKRLVLCRYIYNCLCCQRGRKEEVWQRLLFQIKKSVSIGDVALDKNVPTPLPSVGTLAHKPLNYLAKDNLRPPVLALSSRQVKIKLSTAARRS